MSDVILFY